MQLRKTFRFEASHILPRHKGKCSRLHGHSWVLHVFVSGIIKQETGFVMDYAEISEVVKPLIEKLDHHHFGQWRAERIEGGFYDIMNYTKQYKSWGVIGMPIEFYPSSENLLIWIAEQLSTLKWSKLALEETCTSYCELTRDEFERDNLCSATYTVEEQK